MKAKELRELSLSQLSEKLFQARKKLQEMRFSLASGRLKNPHKIKETKKEIARILTLINEKRKNDRKK